MAKSFLKGTQQTSVQTPQKLTNAPPIPLLYPTLPRVFGNPFSPAYSHPQAPHFFYFLGTCICFSNCSSPFHHTTSSNHTASSNHIPSSVCTSPSNHVKLTSLSLTSNWNTNPSSYNLDHYWSWTFLCTHSSSITRLGVCSVASYCHTSRRPHQLYQNNIWGCDPRR